MQRNVTKSAVEGREGEKKRASLHEDCRPEVFVKRQKKRASQHKCQAKEPERKKGKQAQPTNTLVGRIMKTLLLIKQIMKRQVNWNETVQGKRARPQMKSV